MTKHYTLFIIILFPVLLFSQENIEKEIKNADNITKINLYLKNAKKNLNDKPELSKLYLKKGAGISEKFNILSDSVAEIYYLTGQIYYKNNELDSAAAALKKSADIASNNENNKIIAKTYYILGNISYYKNDFFKSLETLNKALLYANKTSDSILIADILIDKAYTFDVITKRDSALQMLEKATEISNKTGYTEGVGKAEIASGNIYYGINDFDKAYIHYENALNAAIISNNLYGKATSYKNIAAIQLEKNEYELAVKYLKLSEKEYQKMNYTLALSNVYNDFAIIYSKKNNKDSCYYYLKKSLDISKELGTEENIAISYNVYANALSNFGKYKLSNLYLDSCIRIADKIKFGLMLQKSYKTYSDNLFAQKRFKEAFRHFKKYNKVKDSLLTEEFQNRLAQFEIKYQTTQKEKEILELKNKELINKANKRFLILFIIFLAIIFVLIIIRIQTKRKKDSEIQKQKILLHQKEKELISAKLKQKEIEEKKLKTEIEFKTKQLATHALNMMQKNKLLQELTEHISIQSKKMSAEGKQELHSVKKQLEAGLNVDKDWDLFKIYFEQINESFFDKLKKINSELTNNDFRLCALIKLNLSLKETASVLNISPDSAKNARYRLKKKLKLEGTQNLSSFINNL